MNILVAGGAGFIGSNLIDKLLDLGHYVVCLDNFFIGTKKNIEHLANEEKFKFYEHDICDSSFLENLIRSEKIEYVMHLAANSDIQASANNPSTEYMHTYSTTFHLLENMRRCGVRKFFFASTSAVYGDKKDELLNEKTAELFPVSYYGAAKLGSESLVHAYSYMNDMSSLIFRFPNVIGPRLTHGVVFDFIKKLKKDSTCLEILGDGRQIKPYIYVDDLIDAIVEFMNQPNGVSIYNIGVETSTSVSRIADIICEEMNFNSVKYKYTGGTGGWKGDVPKFQYSLEKIHTAGWQAKHTSDEAIQMAVQWAVKQC